MAEAERGARGHKERADRRFAELTESYLADRYESQPVLATSLGIHDFDDCLDNVNRFAVRDYRDRVRGYLHAIDRISLAELDSAGRLDYRLARSSAQMTLYAIEQQRVFERRPDAYVDLIFNGIYPLIQASAGDEARAAGLLGRLRAVPEVLNEARANLQRPPALCTEFAIRRIECGRGLFARTLPDCFASLADRALQYALSAAADRARRALDEYAAFLHDSILPHADGDFAIGKELYNYNLRMAHFLDPGRETCEDLLEIGQATLAEAKRELSRLAGEIEPGSDRRDVVSSLKRHHPTASDLNSAYVEAIRNARAFLSERALVALPANETLTVEDTPEFVRTFSPAASYVPPAPFAARQEGRLRICPVPNGASPDDAEQLLRYHCFGAIAVAAMHKGFPGHHLQLATAGTVSTGFRRHFAGSTLLAEGWALYGEEMMWEQGFIADPGVRMMRMHGLLCRACGLLIDVGLHTRRMTPEQAAEFLRDEAGIEEADAVEDVRRYVLSPTLAMTGVVGRRALFALRSEMQRRLGSRFSLRGFHDWALSYGSVPPALLRDALNDHY